MPEHDEYLQRKLDQLEAGFPLKSVLSDIPAEDSETIQLLKLAAAMRTMPHPNPLLAQLSVGKEKTVPVRRVTAPARLASLPRWVPIGALGGIAALMFVVVAALIAFSVTGVSAKSATLMDVVGQVNVAASDSTSEWRAVGNGEKLQSGERIQTSDGSSVTLVFPEGSRSVIQPNSDVTLSKLETASGGVIHVVFNQRAGKSVHSVVPFGGKRSSFLVQTPSGTANVRGTHFNVNVGSSGRSRFSVDTGKVLVANPVSDVLLTAGQATAGLPGLALEEPAYGFAVQGELTEINGSEWKVAGVVFTVNEETNVSGAPETGDLLSVEGRILEGGTRVADTVVAAVDEDEYATFTGELSTNEGGVWVIGGLDFLVNEQTELGDGLVQGASVKVIYTVLTEGQLQAWSIDALVDEEPIETPESPAGALAFDFDPDEIEVHDCETQVVATGHLMNESEAALTNLTLDSMVVAGADYYSSMVMQPASFGSIEPGQTVEFTNTLTLTEDWANAPTGTEVKLRVFVSGADGMLEALPARLTITVISTCEPTVTPTSSVTPGTETPTVTPTDDDETEAEGACSTGSQHPTGMKLAERYGVTYEEIMGWFCQQPHFGFGEIDLAYSLAEEKGIAVEEIFAMKAGGMGWGNIKQELQVGPHRPAVVDNDDETGDTITNNGNNGNNGNKPEKTKPTRKPKK